MLAQLDTWLSEGYQNQQRDDQAQAEACYRRVLAAKADHPGGLYMLGSLLEQQGKLEDAEQLLSRAVQCYPDFAEAYAGLGNIFKHRGLVTKAVDAYLEALKNKFDVTKELFEFGKQYEAHGQIAEALCIYENIVKLEPGCFHAHIQMGDLFLLIKESTKATTQYLRALELVPDNAEIQFYLATAYAKDGQFQVAQKYFNNAISIQPENALFNNGLGMLLRDQGELQMAYEYMTKAVERMPESIEILVNMGVLLGDMSRFNEAMEYFDRALSLKPNHAAINFNKSVLNLKFGKFFDGWKGYGFRWDAESGTKRKLSYSEWQGEDIRHKCLLIYSEQGLGDQMMFASCFSEILGLTDSAVIECHYKLVELFRRSFPGVEIHGCHSQRDKGVRQESLAWLQQVEPIDVQVAMGSLPGFFRNRREDFPMHHGYLQAEPKRVDYWKTRLSEIGVGLKVGISWRGGSMMTRGHLRSIPLSHWGSILSLPDIQFVNLQYTNCQDELAEVQREFGIEVHHWQQAIDDYNETAALVSALDRVVSISTSIIDLCGALGCYTDVLLPWTTEWRYLSEGDRMPWYPSVHLHRQQRQGEWGQVLYEVAKELGDQRTSKYIT